MAATREILVTGGYVITMDEAGDLPRGDVLIRDGRIVDVGTDIEAPGAEVIDAAGKIVAPGLVDTHWHLWNTLLRGLSDGMPGGDSMDRSGYFVTCAALGKRFLPADMYEGTRLACAEAIDAGITTVHDWAHNIRGLDWAEAGLRALAESGLRARFSYGYQAGHPNDRPMALDDLSAVASRWETYSAGGRIHLGVAWRGTGGSNPAMRVAPEIYRAEIEAARGLGLPVTVHACGPRAAAGQIATYAAHGLLGPDLQVVHLNSASEAEMALAAEYGTPASVSPYTELQIGYGQPVTGALLAAGVPTGLSVDTTMLSGNADMFGIMKATQACANALAYHEFALSARDVLRLATISGAQTLGLGSVTGSLTAGKRADLIVVSVDAWNLGVLTDVPRLLVTAAHPGNVDTVLADGVVVKRGGALTGYDVAEVTASARSALAGVLARELGAGVRRRQSRSVRFRSSVVTRRDGRMASVITLISADMTPYDLVWSSAPSTSECYARVPSNVAGRMRGGADRGTFGWMFGRSRTRVRERGQPEHLFARRDRESPVGRGITG